VKGSAWRGSASLQIMYVWGLIPSGMTKTHETVVLAIIDALTFKCLVFNIFITFALRLKDKCGRIGRWIWPEGRIAPNAANLRSKLAYSTIHIAQLNNGKCECLITLTRHRYRCYAITRKSENSPSHHSALFVESILESPDCGVGIPLRAQPSQRQQQLLPIAL